MKKIFIFSLLCIITLVIHAQSNGPGSVWFTPDSLGVNAGDLFDLEIHVDTGIQVCRVFGFDLSYHAGTIDYIGYKATSNLPVTYVEEWLLSGQVSISSIFTGHAEGPSSDLHVLTLTFRATAALTPTISLGVNNLLEDVNTPIGTPRGDSVQVSISGSMTSFPTPGTTRIPTPTPVDSTPAPTPAGDLQWSKGFHVYNAVASGNPLVQGALVEASALTQNAAYTDENGECSIQVWAHDTASVSVDVSADGYISFTNDYSALDSTSIYDIGLNPEGNVTPTPTPTPTTPQSPPPPEYSLYVDTVGFTNVTITVDPPGSTNKYPVSISYSEPTTVTLTANDYEYSNGAKDIFYSWDGDLTGNTNPATIYVDGAKSVTAQYVHGDPTPTNGPTPTLTPVSCDCDPGDVNCSGNVDIVDALLVAQFYVGLNPAGLTECAADVDCNGRIEIIDALLIAQYYVGLIAEFPC
jgi:hypothetical protein